MKRKTTVILHYVIRNMLKPVFDAQARRGNQINSANESGLICGQPAGVGFMAFIAWRNVRLINRIATLYGTFNNINPVCVCLSWYC
ncbi:hypothetical protein [Escherichia coli]|uniref:hypothetical protein n=1 Tax=Escherichia coli TaxID=562 RepID=UPI0022284B5D|nr:hypothetical protein [Escherichia coli]MCW3371897.1 hypothetical protein [Escherichia coli]